MKSALLALAMISPAFAVHFDSDGFGQSLNGWHKNGIATYQFTDATYRTYIPTITSTPAGGIFLSTQVDLVAFGTSGAISHIDLTFDRRGTLLSAQIRSNVGSRFIDTGLIRRPEAPAVAEGQPAPAFNATTELLVLLFSSFDQEIRKISEGKENEKRDLFNRMGGGKDAKSANLSAGLRHNINLLLRYTR